MIGHFELDDRHVSTWRERICDELLDADAPWHAGQRLGMELGIKAVHGAVNLDVTVHHGGLTLERTAARVAREQRQDAMGLTCVTAGSTTIATPGRQRVVQTGELCLISSEQPFKKTMSRDYAEVFLYMPVPLMRTLWRELPAQQTMVSDGHGLGGVLRDALVALSRQCHQLSTLEWTAGMRAVITLTAGVFGDVRDDERIVRSTREIRRGKVLEYIDTHLGEPELAPPQIAAAFGMSLRYLHLLFEDTDTSVAATAHFSRAFKARFGCSPRELRHRGG